MEKSSDLPPTLDKKTASGPIYKRYVNDVIPWFDSVAKRGSFNSQTLGTDGRPPVIQYCHVPAKGREGKNVPAIVFVLGWSESFLKYKEIFYDLHKKYEGNINIWCMDHCSQGISGRWAADDEYSDRGWNADFRNYAKDQVHFINETTNIRKQKTSGPRFLFCHSMGGLVGTHVVTMLPGVFEKIVLSAPMFTVKGLDGVPFSVLRAVAQVVDRALGKGKEWVPGAASKPDHRCPEPPGNDTSNCIDRLECWNIQRYQNPKVVVGGVTWGWLNQSNIHRCDPDTITKEVVDAFEMSDVLLLSCELESIVEPKSMVEFAEAVGTCEWVNVEGSLHEAFFERDEIRDWTFDR
ncbi:hypothetical protein TL16_g06461 [Triparma laevis f. inornata]|nr:hypothetical protein TL16_g06461 [Triparma laevis f. inornata]GMI00330.1 hypothetical protein TrLO_g11362 [Triparma laevis f. longispina]